ncbi:MAG: tricarboxylate transporter [Proteobacteria bacterium]|nr:tricarboxylate transporter [Pseudomonadota bacterium]
MKTNKKRNLWLILLIAFFTVFGAMTVAAKDYKGKRIRLIIPFKEGGGTDTWGRFYAEQFSRGLPGEPVVSVFNIPGGGSVKGANQFQSRARKDGLTLLGASASTQFPYILGDPRVRYDYKTWSIVLATPTGGVVYLKPELGVLSAFDLAKLDGKELRFGSQGALSMDLVALIAFDMLDLNIKPVFGMKGRGSGRLAFERGETQIDYQTTSAFLKKVMPLVKEGQAVPAFTWGVMDQNGKMHRDPTFPELPHFSEVYERLKGEKPSGIQYESWKSLYLAGFAVQKGIYLPRKVSDDIKSTWVTTARNLINEPGFKQKSEKVLGVYDQYVGETAEKFVKEATEMSDSHKNWILDWLKKQYNIGFK